MISMSGYSIKTIHKTSFFLVEQPIFVGEFFRVLSSFRFFVLLAFLAKHSLAQKRISLEGSPKGVLTFAAKKPPPFSVHFEGIFVVAEVFQ